MKLGMDVMSWYYHVVVKNWADLEARGSKRERATFECETIYVVPLEFIYKGNIELHECHVKFWNYSGFVCRFLYIN